MSFERCARYSIFGWLTYQYHYDRRHYFALVINPFHLLSSAGWYESVDRWLFFLFVLFLVEISIASYFRALSYTFKDQDTAQSAGTGLLSV